MRTPGPPTVLFDTPRWQVFAQAWPRAEGPAEWTWGLAGRAWPGLLLEGGRVGLVYRVRAGLRRATWRMALPAAQARLHRSADRVQIAWPPNAHGLRLTLEMRPDPAGWLRWQLRVQHRGKQPVLLERWIGLEVGPRTAPRRGIFGRLAGAVSHFGRRTEAPDLAHPGALRLHDRPAALQCRPWDSTDLPAETTEAQEARPRFVRCASGGVVLQPATNRALALGYANGEGLCTWRLHPFHPYVHLYQPILGRVLTPGQETTSAWAGLYVFAPTEEVWPAARHLFVQPTG